MDQIKLAVEKLFEQKITQSKEDTARVLKEIPEEIIPENFIKQMELYEAIATESANELIPKFFKSQQTKNKTNERLLTELIYNKILEDTIKVGEHVLRCHSCGDFDECDALAKTVYLKLVEQGKLPKKQEPKEVTKEALKTNVAS